MNQLKLRRYFPLFLLLALVLIVAVVPVSAVTKHHVNVQILALNDFHGNLQPPSGSSGRVIIVDNPSPTPDVTVDAGGVEYLSTHVAALRATNPNTVFVSAGDMIGASPLLSALFHDEPSVEAFNHMGLDFNAVGNHEFDEGTTELLRMQNGGCHPVDGCQDGTPFDGASFQYLAANVVSESTGRTLLSDPEGRPLQPSQLGSTGLFGWFRGSKQEEQPAFTEPERGSLTEPPVGYLTPSPNQPYGTAKQREAPAAPPNWWDRAVGQNK